MASGVYKNPEWLEANLRNVPVHALVILPPAEGRAETLQISAAASGEKTGAFIPPAQVTAGLQVIQDTVLPNAQTYGWPTFVLSGNIEKGFGLAAIHSPKVGTKVLQPGELADFAGLPGPAIGEKDVC